MDKKISIERIYEKEKENHSKLISVLEGFDNIKIIAPPVTTKTIGVVSCIFDGYSSDNIGQVLIRQGIEVRTGLHCSPLAHKFLGTFPEGTVRFSVGYFNNDNDFEVLEKALNLIRNNLSEG